MVEIKKAIFDDIANFYDDWYKTPLGNFADTVENNLIFKYLPELNGKKLLDVGCGTGHYSIRAYSRGATVTGMDFSEKMLYIAKEKAKLLSIPLNFILGDMDNIPFNDNTFDVVISVTSLEFSKNPKNPLKEFLRVLKPGCKAVIGVLSKTSLWSKKRIKQAYSPDNIYFYAHFFEPKELKNLLIEAGFKSVIIDSSLFLPPNDNYTLPKFVFLREFLGRYFTPLKGAFIVGVGRKEK